MNTKKINSFAEIRKEMKAQDINIRAAMATLNGKPLYTISGPGVEKLGKNPKARYTRGDLEKLAFGYDSWEGEN